MMSIQNSNPLLFLLFLCSFFKKSIKSGSPLIGELCKVLFRNSLLLRQSPTNIEMNWIMEITE